jgi:hypothetical protein
MLPQFRAAMQKRFKDCTGAERADMFSHVRVHESCTLHNGARMRCSSNFQNDGPWQDNIAVHSENDGAGDSMIAKVLLIFSFGQSRRAQGDLYVWLRWYEAQEEARARAEKSKSSRSMSFRAGNRFTHPNAPGVACMQLQAGTAATPMATDIFEAEHVNRVVWVARSPYGPDRNNSAYYMFVADAGEILDHRADECAHFWARED